MKRLTLILTALLLNLAPALSRPALKGTARVKQPDGTMLTIRLEGDEYYNYNTTDDGYSLVRNAEGYYVYAQLDGTGRLAPTAHVARDLGERTVQEVAYLQTVGKQLRGKMPQAAAQARRRNRVARQQTLNVRRAAGYDYSKFKGLVILVEYNDCKFRYDNYAEIMEQMINEDNYQGVAATNIGNIACTGSMRDFYRDNSSGAFVPTFDVVGPVKVNRSQYYPRPNGTSEGDNYVQLMVDACTAADSQVNFKDYDVDKDGLVDMIYFIFAGLPSYISGNDGHLLWPHQWDISYERHVRKDGVYLGRYACSTELFGSAEGSVLEGIGTMCHEFSHVLGLPDFYDTNNYYADGDCDNPQEWSVMANGADFNYGRTPCNLSLFERYALGFAYPQKLTEPGKYSIEALHKGNGGYRIDTPQKKEYFLLENRQKVKWDSQLPGHGMLIFRVDSTNADAWIYNFINDNPEHPYYQLIRAKGGTTSSGRDPFPGTARVRTIDNTTSPANLLSWGGLQSPLGLRTITESGGVISFEAYNAHVLQNIILPESLTLSVGSFVQLSPTLEPEDIEAELRWSSDNESVATVTATGLVSGHAAGTAHITATGDGGVTATCTVTVSEIETVADIAHFLALPEGSLARLTLDDTQVLYAYDGNIFLRDASAAVMLSGVSLSVARDNLLNGTIAGQRSTLNNMPVMVPVDGLTTDSDIRISEGESAQPRMVTMDKLDQSCYADLVKVMGATLVRTGGVWAVQGDQRVRLWNTFQIKSPKISLPSNITGKYFNVTAIYATNVLNGAVINELCLLMSPEEGTAPAPKGDVNLDGAVDVSDISTIISILAQAQFVQEADVNADGIIDVADIATVISIMAGQEASRFNLGL